MLFCCGGSGLADVDIALVAHLDGELKPLAANQLRPLNGHDSRFDPEFLEGSLQLLNDGFLDLSLRVDHASDQSFAQASDPLSHHISGVGDFDDQHTKPWG